MGYLHSEKSTTLKVKKVSYLWEEEDPPARVRNKHIEWDVIFLKTNAGGRNQISKVFQAVPTIINQGPHRIIQQIGYLHTTLL